MHVSVFSTAHLDYNICRKKINRLQVNPSVVPSAPLYARSQNVIGIDAAGRTRRHSLKLVKCRCNKNIRKFFFSHQVVSKRNMLNNDSVTAKTVNGFKTKLERERTNKMGLFWTNVCWTSRP